MTGREGTNSAALEERVRQYMEGLRQGYLEGAVAALMWAGPVRDLVADLRRRYGPDFDREVRRRPTARGGRP